MKSIQFFEYQFDLPAAELSRDGARVPLERQPALALAALLERPGGLVRREDLRRAIWPEQVHVDFEGGMNYCIRQLRVALGDDARQPRFIATVPRQGYRFVAPVRVRREETAAGVPPGRTRRTVAAAVLLTVLGAGVVWDSRMTGAGRGSHHHDTAVRVARALHDLVF